MDTGAIDTGALFSRLGGSVGAGVGAGIAAASAMRPHKNKNDDAGSFMLTQVFEEDDENNLGDGPKGIRDVGTFCCWCERAAAASSRVFCASQTVKHGA